MTTTIYWNPHRSDLAIDGYRLEIGPDGHGAFDVYQAFDEVTGDELDGLEFELVRDLAEADQNLRPIAMEILREDYNLNPAGTPW